MSSSILAPMIIGANLLTLVAALATLVAVQLYESTMARIQSVFVGSVVSIVLICVSVGVQIDAYQDHPTWFQDINDGWAFIFNVLCVIVFALISVVILIKTGVIRYAAEFIDDYIF